MSTFWSTTVYFPRLENVPIAQVTNLLAKLANADLVFFSLPEPMPDWLSLDSLEDRKVDTLDEALQLTQQFRGGQISLYNHSTRTQVYLLIGTSGISAVPETAAEYRYGSIGLRVDYAYLHSEPSEAIRKRYIQIFRWSNIIAQSSEAIYGWGDIDGHVDVGRGDAVPAAALDQWEIPRISWWNYYSNVYKEHVGANRLSSAGPWMLTTVDSGLILILRPPEEIGAISARPDFDEIFG